MTDTNNRRLLITGSRMKEKLQALLEDLLLLLKILTWEEYWFVVCVPLSIFGIWLIFWLALYLPIYLRVVVMWGIIIGLALLSPRLSKRD